MNNGRLELVFVHFGLFFLFRVGNSIFTYKPVSIGFEKEFSIAHFKFWSKGEKNDFTSSRIRIA